MASPQKRNGNELTEKQRSREKDAWEKTVSPMVLCMETVLQTV